MNMLGFYTRKKAWAEGFTHEGIMHGLLPCWVVFDNQGIPTVQFKHLLWQWLDEPLSFMYAVCCQITGNEPHFSMYVKELKK